MLSAQFYQTLSFSKPVALTMILNSLNLSFGMKHKDKAFDAYIKVVGEVRRTT